MRGRRCGRKSGTGKQVLYSPFLWSDVSAPAASPLSSSPTARRSSAPTTAPSTPFSGIKAAVMFINATAGLAGIWWATINAAKMHVDLTEGRYLLSGASDGSAAVYDIQHTTDYDGGLIAKHKNLFVVDKQHNHGHKFAISTAIWYPIDTGLFITGSFDHHVKVWDTNMIQVVMDFKMPGKVYGTAMSSIATAHMLIATGSADVQVRLCDIASGAFTHTLSGHRDGVMSLEWSTSSEWILMTGGCDGAIRFWDIRRAGCFCVLDQSRSQLGRRPPFSQGTPKRVLEDFIASTVSTGKSSFEKTPVSQKRMPVGNGKKQLTTSRKNQNVSGGPSTQRLHPGMSSSHNRATAHYGAVTGLRATSDGMYLLSSGSDSRLRLWDIESGCNTLVNFEAMRLQTSKAIQLAAFQDSSLVFVPSMASVKDQELYTGSNDRQILVWSPSIPAVTVMEEDDKKGQTLSTDRDNWSD
ncbi:DNA excision repair protein ERCC-8-like isoform X4 [Ananas comosus]|uniref:DNA excision repair protein ERCC-8-like isoform X4 n=1 Tax=Ananas comosus TaxID=4615 RepID=A0A6P5F403_ANACO|nr:DNA excision repair protein ERCC-8-like isoform X4 [Ananas comosus]